MPSKKRKSARKAKTLSTTTQAWMEKIGRRIKDEREKRSWKQDGLAKTAGLSRKTVSDLENARRSYGIDSLIDSALALGIDPWTLFGGVPKTRPRRKIEHDVLHDDLDRILSADRDELVDTVKSLLRRLSTSI